jgi:hypothetical protein
MSKLPFPYRKVRGRGLSWRGHGSLWLAEDHLLEATSVIIAEHYRRFFFNDIRAFVLQRTKGRSNWAWFLGVVGGACALIAGGSVWFGMKNASEDWHSALYVPAVLFGIPAVCLLVLFVVNLLLGPTCRCHVLTATGWRVLSAPARVRPANRIQTQLAALIHAAQGPPPAAEPPPL